MRIPLRTVATLALLLACAGPVCAQEPPPRIPFYVFDVHGTVPRFPSNEAIADSRGMQLAELPGTGVGVQAALHLYPLRWRAITFGIGGEVTANRSTFQPPDTNPSGLKGSTEKFLSAAPQLSFNFGTGHGWSYLSGGIGVSQWSIIPNDRADPFPSDTARLKTINYGGGARWFAKPHLAFSFDVRFYAINPGPDNNMGLAGSPRTTLLIFGAGVSLK